MSELTIVLAVVFVVAAVVLSLLALTAAGDAGTPADPVEIPLELDSYVLMRHIAEGGLVDAWWTIAERRIDDPGVSR